MAALLQRTLDDEGGIGSNHRRTGDSIAVFTGTCEQVKQEQVIHGRRLTKNPEPFRQVRLIGSELDLGLWSVHDQSLARGHLSSRRSRRDRPWKRFLLAGCALLGHQRDDRISAPRRGLDCWCPWRIRDRCGTSQPTGQVEPFGRPYRLLGMILVSARKLSDPSRRRHNDSMVMISDRSAEVAATRGPQRTRQGERSGPRVE